MFCWRADGWRRSRERASDERLAHLPTQILILAGTDRLDKALTIGQMQGKFQLALLPQVSDWAGY